MATTIPELQTLVDEITAEATRDSDVETAASTLLNTLGEFMRTHAGDAAAIEALGIGLTNAKGVLTTSADALAAAIVANTPSA